ncbi:MAG TPA: methyltransferase domain-containing protein [Actinomycetota bacterium]|nr:methyltransferase domain-containing protein [Actinomycetota bacterium]
MRAVNLGCGLDVRSSENGVEWVNLDIAKLEGVDVVHDLEVRPWPFADGEFDAVLADDVWEHVDDWRGFMGEVWRILAPGGQAKIRTCAWGVEESFRDPDHKRWATRETFAYWTPGHWLNEKYPHYADGCGFAEIEARREGDNWVFVLEKLPEAE